MHARLARDRRRGPRRRRERRALGRGHHRHRGAARARPPGRARSPTSSGDAADLAASRARSCPAPRSSPCRVPEVDWVARFREGFRPFRVGRFDVVPPWECRRRRSPDVALRRPRAAPSAPAPTRRRGSASRRSRTSPPPRRSAARSTSARERACSRSPPRASAPSPVVASDIDPEATAASRHHAALNGARLHVVRADGGGGLPARRASTSCSPT